MDQGDEDEKRSLLTGKAGGEVAALGCQKTRKGRKGRSGKGAAVAVEKVVERKQR
jgi:hypothetical protein